MVNQEALERVSNFVIGGRVSSTIRYEDDLVLLLKNEETFQGIMVERGRGYAMEMDIDKSKLMRIPRKEEPLLMSWEIKNQKTWISLSS